MLAFSALAGCSKGKDLNTENTPSNTVENKEPVTLKLMLQDKIQFPADDPVVKELEKRANVKLEVEIPPSANYVEKVRLIITSGDKLPDVIHALPEDLIRSCIDSKKIIPVTKYFNETKYLKNKVDPRTAAAITINNELWGIPKNSWVYASGMYLRQDWINKLGIELGDDGKAITLAKFEEIMNAFTFKDPDGNGQNDTYGFGRPLLDTNGTGWDKYVPEMIMAAFDAGKGWMKGKDGVYTNTDLTTNWNNAKRAMNYYRSLIEKKVVDPEIFTAKTEQHRDRLYKGKVGSTNAFGSTQSYFNFIGPMKQVNPDAELVWINGLVGPEGKYKIYRGGSNSAGNYYVTSECKSPEAFVNMMDYIASPEGTLLVGAGLEGKHYTMENGNPIRKTEEQKKASTEFRSLSLLLTMVRDYKNPDWYFDIVNSEPTVAKRVDRFIKESLDVEYNDDLGLKAKDVPQNVLDKVSDYSKEMTQVLIKYLLGQADETALDSVRNKMVNSAEFKENERLLNEVYKNR